MSDPNLNSIYAARRRLRRIARRTPLERSKWLSERAGCDVHLKLECWQRTRSFKIRGATNAVLALGRDAARARGLVAASAGNHGQGVALAGREAGARVTIFVPADAPETKKQRIHSFGAALEAVQGTYDDAEEAAYEHADTTGAHLVHPFSDPDVVAGQGTVGLEIIEELPDVREAVVPVGGGGLIAGIGTALEAAGDDGVRVLGVQSERARSMHDSFAAGRVVDDAPGETLADGLAGAVDEDSLRRARRVVDRITLVSEDAIARAIRALYDHHGIVAEGAGAVPVAAVLEGALELRGPAVLVASGGNIDANRLARILGDA